MKIIGIIFISTIIYMLLVKFVCNLLYFNDEKRIDNKKKYLYRERT